MKGDRLCPKCGQVIPFGQVECPICSSRRSFFWKLERESLILLSFALLAIFFVITGFVVKGFHGQEKALASQWYERGDAALKANRPQEAVGDFHNALNYSRNNDLDLLHLAQALVQEGHLDEADAYLRTLWDREPGDGEINLELARVSIKQGRLQDAIRYYHNAIYGVWVEDAIAHRRQVRIELTQLLLQEGMKDHADSELITLAGGLPEDAALHVQAGEMFLQVPDYPHALQEFEHAIRLDHRRQAAWAGAGEAAFQLRNYSLAVRYLERARAEKSGNPQAEEELKVSRWAMSADPFESRLVLRERVRRALAAFNHALARLNDCAKQRGVTLPGDPTQGALEAAAAQALKLQPNAVESKLIGNPDQLVPIMDVVSTIEGATAEQCGQGTALDRALLLITTKQGANP